MKCLIHLVGTKPGEIVKFSDTSWNSVVKFSSEWRKLDGEERKISETFQDVFEGTKSDADKVYGYHIKCYRRFCDKQRQGYAANRVSKREAESQSSSATSINQPDPTTPSPKKRLRSHRPLHTSSAKSSTKSASVLPPVCIIHVCKKVANFVKVSGRYVRERLAQCETIDGGLLREAATRKRDESILKHIRDKDCVAIEVRYHRSCHRKYTRKPPSNLSESDQHLYKKAFDLFSTDVICNRIINNREILYMSKLLIFFKSYVSRVEDIDASNYRLARLKERLQVKFPQLVFYRPSKQTKSEMVFVEDTVHLEKLKSSTSETTESTESSSSETVFATTKSNRFDEDSLHFLYTSALKLRNEFSKTDGYDGPWPPTASDFSLEKCKSIIPIPLYNTVAWIVKASDEPTLDNYVEVEESIHLKLLSILQDLVQLQSRGRKHTPKSLALGLTVRHLTGSKKIIDLLNGFGHTSSHQTILRYDTALAQLQLNKGPVFIPDGFQQNVNTLLVWDNIDFSEETTTGHGTTHHTNGISIQNISLVIEASEVPVPRVSLPKVQSFVLQSTSKIDKYVSKKRIGPPVITVGKDIIDIKYYTRFHQHQHQLDIAFVVAKYFGKMDEVLPGWTGFNTEISSSQHLIKSKIAYLPVIEASPTEMDTVFTILNRSVEFANQLNLQNITVVFDLTIYAKAQEIRWTNENFYNKLIIRLGEFHTSMSFLSIIGKRYRDAGLQDVLIEAGIVAPGSINGVLEGKQYNRSINSHKLMFEALHRLKLRSFLESLSAEANQKIERFINHMINSYPTQQFLDLSYSNEFSEIILMLEEFDQAQSRISPTYALWNSYLKMVETLLSFIRATRQSNWDLHISSIRSMLPWYFAYDKTHYARYLPIYWMEMVQLPTTHQEAFLSLTETGQWTSQRQVQYGFSAVACDQTIEQTCNKDSKTSGGITGFTLNRNAVRRWILSQNERASIHHQCEQLAGTDQTLRPRRELDKSRRQKDEQQVTQIIECLDQMVNPFSSDSTELLSINSGVVASDVVRNNMLNAYDLGEAALMKFFEERLVTDSTTFHAPIKQLKLKTFSDQLKRNTKTKSGKEVALQSDRKLFSRLLVISQQKKVDLKEVLTYSLGPVSYPLASSNGSLAKTNKATLLQLIESKCKDHIIDTLPDNAAIMVDGMAWIQSLPKHIPDTFGEVADFILSGVLNLAKLHKMSRIDFVTDLYPDICIKNAERSNRESKGSQVRQIYGKDQKVPQQWASFLRQGKNKESFVKFLHSHWQTTYPVSSMVSLYVTHGDLCSKLSVVDNVVIVEDVPELQCDHIEADTRLLLHANHASNQMFTDIVIKSPDTDVAIITLSLQDDILSRLYFYTGSASKSRIINLQKVYEQLGSQICSALIGLHVFTGCDTTSAFHGKGKTKAFDLTIKNFEHQRTFSQLGSGWELNDTIIKNLEKFVCQLYGQTGNDVNLVRYKLFCLKNSTEQSLPPTKDALIQHIKRANYQTVINKKALYQFMTVPSPSEHGWNLVENELTINWMTLDPAPDSILKYIHCNCQTKFESKKCSCKSSSLSCTDLCGCIECENHTETSPDLNDDLSDYASDDN